MPLIFNDWRVVMTWCDATDRFEVCIKLSKVAKVRYEVQGTQKAVEEAERPMLKLYYLRYPASRLKV